MTFHQTRLHIQLSSVSLRSAQRCRPLCDATTAVATALFLIGRQGYACAALARVLAAQRGRRGGGHSDATSGIAAGTWPQVLSSGDRDGWPIRRSSITNHAQEGRRAGRSCPSSSPTCRMLRATNTSATPTAPSSVRSVASEGHRQPRTVVGVSPEVIVWRHAVGANVAGSYPSASGAGTGTDLTPQMRQPVSMSPGRPSSSGGATWMGGRDSRMPRRCASATARRACIRSTSTRWDQGVMSRQGSQLARAAYVGPR